MIFQIECHQYFYLYVKIDFLYLTDYFYNKFDKKDENIKELIKNHLNNFTEEQLNRFIYKRKETGIIQSLHFLHTDNLL